MSRSSSYFNCPVCNRRITSKRPAACPKCAEVKFFYENDSAVIPNGYKRISEIGEEIDMPKDLNPLPNPVPSASTAEDPSNPVPPASTADTPPKAMWKDDEDIRVKKNTKWRWLIALYAIIILGIIFFLPRVVSYFDEQAALGQKVAQLESNTVALKQENQDLVQKNQELTAATAELENNTAALTQQNQTLAQKNQELTTTAAELQNNTAALAQENQGLVQKNQELTAAAEQKAKIVNIVDQTDQNTIINLEPVQTTKLETPFAQVYGNEGINILKKLDSKEYGYRWTSSARDYLYPTKTEPWQELTKTEMNQVQNTWFLINFTVPQGYEATVFCHGFNTMSDLKDSKYGYIVMFEEGNYQISIRDWEIVFRPIADIEYRSKDLNRIFTEINNGNKDISHDLALAVVSSNLAEMIPYNQLKQQVRFVDYKSMTIK